MNSKKGRLIVFYGTNNLGKSTQARILINKLNKSGIPAKYLKYPIYDLAPSGIILNKYLREGNPCNLSAREAQIIYALNRTQFQEKLEEYLNQGINIIAEDYTGTGIAWGIGAGIEENFLIEINSHLLKEDVAILFDGERFKEAVEKNHKHEENEEFSQNVRKIHLDLAKKNNWQKVNANLSIEEISEIIEKEVRKVLI
jgi:dTMP kinase